MKDLYSFFSEGAGGTDLPPAGGTYAGGMVREARSSRHSSRKESLAAVVLPEPLIGVGLLDNGDDAIGYEREVISVKVACPEGFALTKAERHKCWQTCSS